MLGLARETGRPPTGHARPARWLAAALLALASLGAPLTPAAAAADAPFALLDAQLAAHPGATGVYVLETGEEALLARAWLAEHAQRSIDVQYFIWSTDNIGILAAEALLRAAQRGVRVRVIVDDLLIDAPDKSLLALAHHPNIEIRIYNPQTSVGIPLAKRIVNALTNFRGVNQRMHDKTVIVDGKVAVTGGRNMAAEYFDYNHRFNFRDRDALLAGGAVRAMGASFQRFWNSERTAAVETLYDGLGLMQKNVQVSDAEVQQVYRELHAYARDPANFAPEVRAAIAATPSAFPRIARQMAWGRVEFISDDPGKNDGAGLADGGLSSAALADLAAGAQRSVVIQSPYLVLSERALALFRALRARGVAIRISTNSLASTDNLPAFSGYRNQRDELLAMGIEIFEYRPDAAVQRQLLAATPAVASRAPTFALHAKSMVVDSRVAFIGTYNLDPRSENLNTEVGVVIHDAGTARAVEAAIETDMRPENSWPAQANAEQWVPAAKRARLALLRLLPLKPLL